MKRYVRTSLAIAALLCLAWGGGLLFAPATVHPLLIASADDAALDSLLGAVLLGMAALFVIAARRLGRDIVLAAATALLFFALALAYQMFIAHGVPAGPVTSVSFGLAIVVAAFLFLSDTASVRRLMTPDKAPGPVPTAARAPAAPARRRAPKRKSAPKRRTRA